MRTKQELFNLAYIGVVTQGRPSATALYWNAQVQCKYRLDDACCAVGHMLVDYSEEMENLPIGMVPDLEHYLPEIRVYPFSFFSELQEIHDDAATDVLSSEGFDNEKFLERFKAHMSRYALDNDLEVPDV